MVPYGPLWSCMVPCCSVMSCIVPYGLVWSCMVPYCLLLSHIVSFSLVLMFCEVSEGIRLCVLVVVVLGLFVVVDVVVVFGVIDFLKKIFEICSPKCQMPWGYVEWNYLQDIKKKKPILVFTLSLGQAEQQGYLAEIQDLLTN